MSTHGWPWDNGGGHRGATRRGSTAPAVRCEGKVVRSSVRGEREPRRMAWLVTRARLRSSRIEEVAGHGHAWPRWWTEAEGNDGAHAWCGAPGAVAAQRRHTHVRRKGVGQGTWQRTRRGQSSGPSANRGSVGRLPSDGGSGGATRVLEHLGGSGLRGSRAQCFPMR